MLKIAIIASLTPLALVPVLSAQPAPDTTSPWVAGRVKQVKAGSVKAWNKIPWAASLTEARRVSRQERRPVFLFTHEGNLELGRC